MVRVGSISGKAYSHAHYKAVLIVILALFAISTFAEAAPIVSLSVTGPSIGTTYFVGNSFTITITGGEPNRPVTVDQTWVYGKSTSSWMTDSNGNFSIFGTWMASEVGSYTQRWYVNNVPANPVLSFKIAALPTVSLSVTGPQSGNTYYAGNSFILTVKGPPNQPVTVDQSWTPYAKGTSSWMTNASGVFSISGTWMASETGSYTQQWAVGGVAASPILSFQILAPPLACGGFDRTNSFIGNFFTYASNPPRAVSVPGVSANVTGVTFLVWHESQSMSSATSIAGSSQGNGSWGMTLNPSSYYGQVGSYSVAARVQDQTGDTLMCPNKAFFGIEAYNSADGPQPYFCALGGKWLSTGTNQTNADHSLIQNGGSVSGSVTIHNVCDVTYNVSGSRSGTSWSIGYSNPSPPSCSGSTWSTSFNETLSNSDTTCSVWNSSWSDPNTGQSNSRTLTADKLPSGETSEVGGWDEGATTLALFRGRLGTQGDSSQRYEKRLVEESRTLGSITDQCWQSAFAGYPNTPPISQQTAQTSFGSVWKVQSDNSYYWDHVGYGSAVVRFYQQQVGSCSLTANQAMTMAFGSEKRRYADNALVISVGPSSYSVRRAGASAQKNPSYPVQ